MVARRSAKSADAFRTISEVAGDLEVPQHVLRFWETRFAQIKPLKRAGGRRYYRPEDIELLRRIRELLYKHGYTIKGVQRLLKDNGLIEVPTPAPVVAAPLAPAPAPVPVVAAPTPAPAALTRAAAPINDLPLFARMPDRPAILATIEELEALKRLLRARRK
ncbi:MAG: MerR family transcriptional regulator [Magnetospirillum sp.]|nr:MerR family transcriptional regulator [Magnetospirillum sp.]